ncbi:MAG: His/Gly/Thr/Pro-type tRNA ligase C-terminal domain-containing protein [Bacteroidota bacterium]
MKKQFTYADKKDIPFTLIIGSEEAETGLFIGISKLLFHFSSRVWVIFTRNTCPTQFVERL